MSISFLLRRITASVTIFSYLLMIFSSTGALAFFEEGDNFSVYISPKYTDPSVI